MGVICKNCEKENYCGCKACIKENIDKLLWTWDETGMFCLCGFCGEQLDEC